MKKKLIALILTLSMILTLAACGGKESNEKKLASKEGVYKVVDLENIKESMEATDFNINQLKIIGEKMYMIADIYMDNGYRICYLTADLEGNVTGNNVIYEQIWQQYEEDSAVAVPLVKEVAVEAVTNDIMLPVEGEIAVEEPADQEWHNIYAYTILSDGKLAYVDGYERYNSKAEAYEMQNYVVVCDENGQEILRTNISEEMEPGTYLYINTLIESGENSLYALCYEKIFEISLTGELLGQYETNEVTQNLYNAAFYKDGKPVFAVWNEDYTKQTYSTIDIRKGEKGEELAIADTISNYTIFDGAGSGYDLVLANNTGVYGYNIGTEEPVLIMNYINSDLATYRLRSICFKDSEQFVAIYNDIIDYVNHVASFTRVAPENVPDREAITIATYGSDTDITKKVIDYNKASEQYKILIEDYSSYGTSEDWYAGINRLNNDIISGKIPDIIIANQAQIPLENYASKGILADFYELMDKDETINRADYAENVFKAYEVEGKLYELPTKFYVWTVFGKTSIFGEDYSLTWDELNAVKAKYPEAEVFSEMTKSNALSNALLFSYSELVDEATGQCYFNTDAFKKILEYANTYPEEINWDELYSDDDYWLKYQSRYIEDRTLLFQNTIYSIYDAWTYAFHNFTEPSTPVGFPTDNGQGSAITALNSFAITSKGEVEGAWDFVKQFITRDAQMMPEDTERYGYWGLPILKEAIEQQAQTITIKPFWIDENGEKVEYDETVWIGEQEIKLEPATEEEAQRWVDFILSVDKKGGYEYEKAMEIISEDVEGYFKGQKSVDEVASVIQSRMDIFINESR